MWTNEIINVVLENKNKNSFYEKSTWSHNDMNVIIQFLDAYSWGAIELTSDQYESIEAVSVDADTYDTQYNSKSRYDISEFEDVLFIDDRNFIGVEFCTVKSSSDKDPIPDKDMLKEMSNLSWFEENYGIKKSNNLELYDALLGNGWAFCCRSYVVVGDITLMGKSNYDYLWISDAHSSIEDHIVEKNIYDSRIIFLNDQEGD